MCTLQAEKLPSLWQLVKNTSKEDIVKKPKEVKSKSLMPSTCASVQILPSLILWYSFFFYNNPSHHSAA